MHVARVFSLPNLRVESLFIDGVFKTVCFAKWHECEEIHEALADQKLEESHNHNHISKDRDLLSPLKNQLKILMRITLLDARISPDEIVPLLNS